ncbi:hypothetical protein BDZ89DRAFT_1067514 [Hymenopellis radicata]|nr:hypothetical protein BDZ89DRAFT_1067514 [Hymenopellis radicata]
MSLVGSVLERAPSGSHAAPRLPSSSGMSGFPVAQHRSKGKSAFVRRREEENKIAGPPTRIREVPVLVPQNTRFNPGPLSVESDVSEDWRDEIGRQNQLRVENMTDEEREKEKQEIFERFGFDIGDILNKAKETREKKRKRELDTLSNKDPLHVSLPEVPITDEEPDRTASPPPYRSISAATSRPSTPNRPPRKLRFAELSPKDVYVYESAPPSPRRKTLLALPPPTADDETVSLGSYKGPLLKNNTEPEPEEGTPEYIRRRYFPSAPATNPDLEWMKAAISDTPSSDASPLDQVRFDLSGIPIPRAKSLALPTHLGLHHHAEGSHAGYTIDDIFLLARSTVVAQRAAMLSVLVGVAKWLRDGCPGVEQDVSRDIPSKTLPLLKRILFAGLEVLPEKGSVGARGIDVVWQCLIGWETREIAALEVDLEDLEYQFGEIELNLPGSTTSSPAPSVSALIDVIPLDKVLPQIAHLVISPPDLGTTESQRNLTSNQHQLLSVVTRIAKHSASAAEAIVQTPRLVAGIVNTFLLLPVTPSPSALKCLTTLIVASRLNAQAICDPADALLKFVTGSPPDPDLLIGTLRVYTALAKYGLYSHSATDAQELWMRLGTHVALLRASRKPRDVKVVEAWAALLEAWMICARDPHRTSPSHDILWSRVVAWGWGDDVLTLNALSTEAQDVITLRMVSTQSAIWGCISAWLEGARVNAVRGGEAEREAALMMLKADFESPSGTGQRAMGATVTGLKTELEDLKHTLQISTLANAAVYASSLASILRLSLACSTTFDLPIPEISQLCASLVSSPVWSMADKTGLAGLYGEVLCRQLSSLLVQYLRFARTLPGTTDDMWLAQAFAIILRLRVGDEDVALDLLGDVLLAINSEWAKPRGLVVPQVIWDRGGLEVLLPIFTHVVQPSRDVRVAPVIASPKSIMESTTLRVPTSVLLTTDWNPAGLPLARDWPLAPLDHILRSGHEASVFKRKGIFPETWDTSETEIVRASLLLAKLGRELVRRFASALVGSACMSRSEVVFGCMKVFMLEHEQDHDKGTDEVFRDAAVGQLMDDLVAPFTLRGDEDEDGDDLEVVARRFLGATPFYQYYTDFVALYDAVSFAHPLFTRLLLPPTSMQYAVDYRRHLYVDFGHLMKNVRVPVDAVIAGGMQEYLYPVETNKEMIRAYLRVLFSDAGAQGFTQLVALHHVSCGVWPDLKVKGTEDEDEAKKLFNIVVERGTADVVRDVMRYTQRAEGSVVVPPQCFELGEGVKAERMALIRRWCASDVAEKMVALYM